MKKKNTTSLIHASLFVSCTAHVALWGGGDTTSSNNNNFHDGFYPHRITVIIENNNQTLDLFSPVSGKEKTCLLHEKHSNITTKNPIPGFVSPIASPTTSPEKIKPKQTGRGGRSHALKPGLACNLFETQKENDNTQNTDVAPEILAIAETFNNDMSQEHKIILAEHVTKYTSSNSISSHTNKKVRDWHNKVRVVDTIKKLTLFVSEIEKPTKEFPRMFGNTANDWLETLGSLKCHNEENCNKHSTGLVLLKSKFESLEELNAQMEDAKVRIRCSYACEKQLAAQQPPRYRAED